MKKKNWLFAIIIIVAALVIAMVMWIYAKRIENIESKMKLSAISLHLKLLLQIWAKREEEGDLSLGLLVLQFKIMYVNHYLTTNSESLIQQNINTSKPNIFREQSKSHIMERELILPMKDSKYDRKKLKKEIETLKKLLPVESFGAFAATNDIFDIHNRKLTTRSNKIRNAFEERLDCTNKYYVFCKN